MSEKRTYATRKPGQPSEVTTPDAPTIAGIGSDDATMEIAGRVVLINEVVLGAYETSGMSLEEWNEAEPNVRDRLLAEKRKEIEVTLREANVSDDEIEEARARAAQAVLRRQAVRAATPAGQKADPRAHLPHRDDIDPFEITAPVETQQGWIAPSKQVELPQRLK